MLWRRGKRRPWGGSGVVGEASRGASNGTALAARTLGAAQARAREAPGRCLAASEHAIGSLRARAGCWVS